MCLYYEFTLLHAKSICKAIRLLKLLKHALCQILALLALQLWADNFILVLSIDCFRSDDSVGCAKSIRPAHSNQSSLVISSLSNHCSIIWVDNISLPILWASAVALLLVQPWVLPTSVQPFNCCQDCMPSISVWFHLVMLFWDHVLHAHQLYNAISAAASNLWLDFNWLLHLPRV